MGQKQRKRNPSAGTLAFVEDRFGIRLQIDIDEVEGTDPRVLERIKSAIAGLSYIYDHDGPNVENIGKAYIDGMNEGITRANKKNRDDSKSGSRSSNYRGSNIGFVSKINEQEEDENE